MPPSPTTSDIPDISDEELIENLKSAPFYQICQDAFRQVTGLPLVLISSSRPVFNACHASANQNLFCRMINSTHGSCEDCVMEQIHLIKDSVNRTHTHTCFAGLRESCVPIRLGRRTIAFLKTGQVSTHPPSSTHLKKLRHKINAHGFSTAEMNQLMELYRQTPCIDSDKYASMITLLSIISLQLTEFINRLVLESRPDEPELVTQAKKYILRHLDQKITLQDIADEVKVSVYHLCKLFKQATSMTCIGFINRQRIEAAKDQLLQTSKTVAEIAYSVGYQSLSQFNRCFLKYAGEPPTEFRKHMRRVNDQFILPQT